MELCNIEYLDLKECTEYIGYYVDKNGNVYSDLSKNFRDLTKLHKLRPSTCSSGYLKVMMKNKNSKFDNVMIHRLMCFTYNGKPPEIKMVASHLDGNKLNNNYKNIIWESQKDNLLRRKEHGTDDDGYRNSRSKINRTQLLEIRQLLSFNNTHQFIADKFNVSRLFITKIKNNHRYKNCF
jgi:hypothetical protein